MSGHDRDHMLQETAELVRLYQHEQGTADSLGTFVSWMQAEHPDVERWELMAAASHLRARGAW